MPCVRDLPPDAYWPDEPEDALSAVLEEAAARWEGNLPATIGEFRAAVVAVAAAALKELGEEHAGARALVRRERETIARLVADFIDAPNPRMEAQCYDVAFGLGIQLGITESAIADQHGVKRQTVSKRCRAIVEAFGVQPGRGMKSPRAVRVYSERAAQVHRRKKEPGGPWRGAEAFTRGFLQQ